MQRQDSIEEASKSFKKRFDLQERKDKYLKACKSCPDDIFVVVEPHPRSKNLKFLKKRVKIHKENPLARLRAYLRQELGIKESESLYLFANGQMCNNDARKMIEVYEENKDEDGFMYVHYSMQDSFGCLKTLLHSQESEDAE